MLEKNKDYVEFTLQCTTVERTRDKDYRQVCLNGYSDYDFPSVPMDVVCKEFGHKVVMISKRDFDRLQAENEHYRELAKQREENRKLTDEVESWQNVTGFSTPEKCSSYIDTLEKKLEDIKDLIEED